MARHSHAPCGTCGITTVSCIYTQPNAAKLRHIARNPKVALNFDSGDGEDVVVFLGEWWSIPARYHRISMLVTTKYHEGILDIEMTDEKLCHFLFSGDTHQADEAPGLDPL